MTTRRPSSRRKPAPKRRALPRTITQRRRERRPAETERRDSQQLFRKIFEEGPLGMAIVGPDNRFANVNNTLSHLLGYEPGELVGRTFMEITHPDDIAVDVAEARRLFKGEISGYEIEKRYIKRHGESTWIHLTGALIRDRHGAPLYAIAMIEDINERKRVQEELQHSLSLLQATLESTTDGILVADLDGRIVSFNERLLDLWRISVDVLTALDGRAGIAFAAQNLKDPVDFTAKVDALYSQPDAESYDVLEFKDGRVFERFSKPQRVEGRSVGRVWSFRDVTARRQAEQALLESEIRLRLLFEQLPLIAWSTDAELRATSSIGSGIRLGLDPNNFFGPASAHNSGGDPEVIAAHRRALHGEPTTFELQRSGRIFTCHVEALRDSAGAITGTIGVATDVTETRAAQEVVERQGRLAAVGQLAAGIAHDFNNILTVVVGVAEGLQTDLTLPANTRELLQLVAQRGRRGSQLVRQILDFSRTSSPAERQSLDLAAFLHDNIKLLERLLTERAVLEIAIPPGTYVVNANALQLQEVLTNLAINARDAMPNGGTVHLQLSALTVDPAHPQPVSGMPAGDWIALSMSDTGIGMDPHVMRHLYEPFFTTKEPGAGTGLGLAQAYGLIKQHDGFIDIASRDGEGTGVTIYLPAVTAAPSPPALSVSGIVDRGRGETILVVEDDADVRQVHTWLLNDLGYRVVSAPAGAEGLDLYRRYREDIAAVLTDMVMPGLDGAALYAALREHDRALPIIILSGYPRTPGAVRERPGKAVTWLQKPQAPEHLAQAIRRAIDTRRL